MTSASASLDGRRRTHAALAARLGALADDELAAMLSAAGPWRASVHGNQSRVIEVAGAKVFVKQIALSDVERTHEGSTANVFDLPDFYHYGVGSAGFGAWRELSASLRASDWAKSEACPCFPLVHHWRVLPRTPPMFSVEQRAWLEAAPAYWGGSDAVQTRLAAIETASASIVLFLEHAPDNLTAWLADRMAGGGLDERAQATVARFHDQWRGAAAFLNARGLLHFDLNASNVLTDGEQLYVADFGLAICEDFDLSPAERAFLESHRLYDRSYVAWAFHEWLAPKADAPALTPALLALVDRGRPVAKVFRRFLHALATGSKTTPYPGAALEAALADVAEITP